MAVLSSRTQARVDDALASLAMVYEIVVDPELGVDNLDQYLDLVWEVTEAVTTNPPGTVVTIPTCTESVRYMLVVPA